MFQPSFINSYRFFVCNFVSLCVHFRSFRYFSPRPTVYTKSFGISEFVAAEFTRDVYRRHQTSESIYVNYIIVYQIGYFYGVVKRAFDNIFRHILMVFYKTPKHLLSRFQIKLSVSETKSVRIFHRIAGSYTQQRFVCFAIGNIYIMSVLCGKQANLSTPSFVKL